jgi:protein CpxP
MKTMTSPRWTRFTQHLLAGGLLVALAGTALQAQAQPGPMGGSHRQGGTMAGAMGGPTGGVMGGMMGGPRAERMLEALGASAEQRVQVRQIMEAARTDQQARHEAGRSLHEQMRLAFVQPTVDANVIEALRQHRLALHDAGSRRMLQAMLEVSRVLTPEQRAKLAEMAAQRRDRMERRGPPK